MQHAGAPEPAKERRFTTIVRLSGELDIYAERHVELALESLAGDDVVIDLRDVRYVSAAFFGALVRLRKRLPASRIAVVGASADVRRVFRVVGAESIVELS